MTNLAATPVVAAGRTSTGSPRAGAGREQGGLVLLCLRSVSSESGVGASEGCTIGSLHPPTFDSRVWAFGHRRDRALSEATCVSVTRSADRRIRDHDDHRPCGEAYAGDILAKRSKRSSRAHGYLAGATQASGRLPQLSCQMSFRATCAVGSRHLGRAIRHWNLGHLLHRHLDSLVDEFDTSLLQAVHPDFGTSALRASVRPRPLAGSWYEKRHPEGRRSRPPLVGGRGLLHAELQ